MTSRTHKNQSGFSLIEILITLVILAFGLIGLAGMQAVGLKNTQSSLIRSQATLIGYDILDRMRSNCSAALNGNYDIALSDASPSSGTTIEANDLSQWRTSISNALTTGKGAVSVSPANFLATVTIQWDDSRSTSGSSTQQLVLTGVLPSLATCQAS
jgi:type IV pilus assembly protein PilV